MSTVNGKFFEYKFSIIEWKAGAISNIFCMFDIYSDDIMNVGGELTLISHLR